MIELGLFLSRDTVETEDAEEEYWDPPLSLRTLTGFTPSRCGSVMSRGKALDSRFAVSVFSAKIKPQAIRLAPGVQSDVSRWACIVSCVVLLLHFRFVRSFVSLMLKISHHLALKSTLEEH